MTAVIGALLGAGIGLGFILIGRGLQVRPVPLDAQLAALDRTGISIAARDAGLIDTNRTDGLRGTFGRLGLAMMGSLGVANRDKVAEQLRVLDKAIERHAYEKLVAAVAGFSLPLIGGVGLATNGIAVSPLVLAGCSAVLGAAGFVYPDMPLADQVAERRRAFKHAFSAYLDLVTVLLAGGAGIESALEGAAESGDGWAFAEIRRSLRRARLTRRTPWDAFADLGTELGVGELNELAASVSLAGDHGARIKASLTAKADALRAGQAAELEAGAEERTEKMIAPVVVMTLGLVLFIAFGAVQAITDGGTTEFAPVSSTVSGG